MKTPGLNILGFVMFTINKEKRIIYGKVFIYSGSSLQRTS